MIFLNLNNPIKSKKVLLPGINYKDLKPVSSLLKPSDILIPMFFVSVLAQISDNIKNVLEPRDIQNLLSVKCYRKALLSGFNSVSLSVVSAISKTLGPELETLSILSVSERFSFLKDLKLKIMLDKSFGKIDFRQRVLSNPLHLMKHRKGLSFKCRSTMVGISIFSPNSVVQGVPISLVDLDLILHSARFFWLSLGLLDEDFDFLLKKDAINKSKTFDKPVEKVNFSDNKSSLKTLIYFELKDFVDSSGFVNFSIDGITLKSDANLVLLEKELRFIERTIPNIPSEVFVSANRLDDVLLRTAIEQRREYKLSFGSTYNNKKEAKSLSLLRSIRFKKLLNEK